MKVVGSRKSEGTPVVYLSFHSDNDYEAQQIGQSLRDGSVLAELFPCNNRASQLAGRLNSTNAPSEVLLVAVSNSNIETDWIRSQLRETVIEPHSKRFSAVFTVFLDPVDHQKLPAYLHDYPRYDLSGREATDPLPQLLQAIYRVCRYSVSRRGSKSRRKKASVGRPEYYTVTGIFEPARPAHEQWNELKRQIALGEIDQRFLYWDLRSAVRWQQSSETSNYRTSQRSMNLLVRYAESIIHTVLEGDSSSNYSLINLGVGTGQKDFQLLRNLLYLAPGSSVVNYFAVDDSFPMIQLTVRVLENLMSSNPTRLRVRYIVDDFMNYQQYLSFIEREEAATEGATTRIIALLGTSLGNFKERKILGAIKQMMRPNDFLLLGVELVGDRNEADLISNYEDSAVREFLYGPIGDTYGLPENDDLAARFRYEVLKDWSDVPGCPTVTARARVNGHEVELLKSTKYYRDEIESFLTLEGFQAVAHYVTDYEDPPLHSKYLLRYDSK